MAEQLLDHAQVGTAIEQVRRERVAQRVRRHPLGQSGRPTQPVQAVPKAADPERRAGVVEEHLAPGGDRGPLGEDRSAMVEVRLQRGDRRSPEEPDPLLAALADDPDLAPPQVERGEVRGGQLTDPQASRVGGLDQGPVTQSEGRRVRHPIGSGGIGGDQLVVHRPEEAVDLVHLEDPGQPARQTRRGDRSPRIAGSDPLPGRPAMEGPDGGQTLGNRRARGSATEPRQVRAQVRATGPAPVHAAAAEPAEVCPDRRCVRTDRVRRRVTGRQGAEEAVQRGIGRRVPRDLAHASGAGSEGRLRRVEPRAPLLRVPAPRARPAGRVPPERPARCGRASADGSGGPPG